MSMDTVTQGIIKELETTIAVLRNELVELATRVKGAEDSRDIVRGHAQASLDRYRAQDKLFDHLQQLVQDRTESPYLTGGEYHRGFTEAVNILVKAREDLKAKT